MSEVFGSLKFGTFQATKPRYLCTNLGCFNLFWEVVRLNLYISWFLHIFIVTCVLHANSVSIFGKAMCVTQTQKDQKDILWTCFLAGFHVTWFHHPSWPNCWLKLRQLDGDVLDQHEAGFQMTSAHAMPGEQSLTKPSHLSYLQSFPGCDYFPNYMQLPTFLSTTCGPIGDLLTPTVRSSAWCKWRKNLQDLVSKLVPANGAALKLCLGSPP